MITPKYFVVIWDCAHPKSLGIFSDVEKATAFADYARAELNAFFVRMGLSGDERVYVQPDPVNFNPEIPK